jgi:hypothetical protein
MRIIYASFCVAVLVIGPLAGSLAHASGHGPVFGFATPVNSKGEWSFDVGIFARNAVFGSQLATRSMLSYGITPQVQLSLVAPALIQQGSLPMSMTSGGEFQGNVAWRFHHQPNAVGRRFESTASVGLVAPGPQDNFGMFRGIHSAPGINAWAATGMASRSSYFWIGGGFMHFAERAGDRRPNVDTTTLVYGYRPKAWRSDRHEWDWRVFAEMTGEHIGPMERAGLVMPGSDANQIFLGPTVLGIYKAFGISGGVQLPIYHDVGSPFPKERARVAVNVSYFLFSRSHSH